MEPMATTVASPPTLAEAERNIEEAEKIAALWREIADVLRRTNGHSNGNGKTVTVAVSDVGVQIAEASQPRGREAVRRIVADRPGVWNLRDIADKALALGWASDRKNIEVAVHRMRASGEVRRVRQGVYDFTAIQGGGA